MQKYESRNRSQKQQCDNVCLSLKNHVIPRFLIGPPPPPAPFCFCRRSGKYSHLKIHCTGTTHLQSHTSRVSLILESTRLTPETPQEAPHTHTPAVTNVASLIQIAPLWLHTVGERGVCVCVGGWLVLVGWGHMLVTSQLSWPCCVLAVVTWGITREDSLTR